ncbi:MAG TPA: hypothetical protein VLF59_03065 [Candidatus Saccharimonadales bacterium]|nr:hypothetical protein [Candidatus Saccharimonadales bacterium]
MDNEDPRDRTKRRAASEKRTSHKIQITGLLTAGLLAISLISYGAWGIAHRQRWPDPTLTQAARSFSFPIYYPSTLPRGFSHTVSGVPKTSSDVFIYTLVYDGNKKLFVSAIPKPAGVKFNDFYNRILSNKSTVLNNAGTAVIGNANNQPIGSLVTSKTWVTMNAPSGIDSARLQTLVSSLRQL